MIMTPGMRKLTLAVHITFSIGWIGAVVAYLALAISAATSQNPQTVRAALIAMELSGWYAIVPLAIGALLTGLVISLGTQWGLFRHYWTLISFALTLFSVCILVLHMRAVSHLAAAARNGDAADPAQLGSVLLHPGIGLLILIVILVLNVYKPQGMTPYGWRKQHAERVRQPRDVGPTER